MQGLMLILRKISVGICWDLIFRFVFKFQNYPTSVYKLTGKSGKILGIIEFWSDVDIILCFTTERSCLVL